MLYTTISWGCILVLMIHFASLYIIGQNYKWKHSHSEERHSNARDCLEICTIASLANFWVLVMHSFQLADV